MLRVICLVTLVATALSQEEEQEVFKLPTLQGNAFFADPFANVDVMGSAWGLSSSTKGDGSMFDGGWAVEPNTANPGDMGLVVKDKAKHHAISAKFNNRVDFTELHDAQKPFVVQYEVKYQDGMECGGSYLKLVSEEDFSPEGFNDRTHYSIMFGPDKCGLDSKIHFIVKYRNPVSGEIAEKHAKPSENFKEIFTDGKSHLITLVLDYDGSYEILIDQNTVNSGALSTDMTPAINPEAEIDDPSDEKPSDWDDKEKIPDPMATKPEDWDEEAPKLIPDEAATMPEDWLEEEEDYVTDPEAQQPEDWDEEEDGAWEAPLIENPLCETGTCGPWVRPDIPNPAYKGRWAPPLIDNPDYSGVWAARRIPNPDFFEDKTPFASLLPITAVGIEMWTMSKDIMFDNILITDSRVTADDWAAESWNKKALAEKLANPGESYIDQFLTFAGENPIVWVMVAGCVLLPLIIYLLCRSGTPPAHLLDEAAEAKKTDKVTPDDEEQEEEKEEDDMPELEEIDDKVVEEEIDDKVIEEEKEEEKEVEEEVVAEEEKEEEAPVKRRTRKAD